MSTRQGVDGWRTAPVDRTHCPLVVTFTSILCSNMMLRRMMLLSPPINETERVWPGYWILNNLAEVDKSKSPSFKPWVIVTLCTNMVCSWSKALLAYDIHVLLWESAGRWSEQEQFSGVNVCRYWAKMRAEFSGSLQRLSGLLSLTKTNKTFLLIEAETK